MPLDYLQGRDKDIPMLRMVIISMAIYHFLSENTASLPAHLCIGMNLCRSITSIEEANTL